MPVQIIPEGAADLRMDACTPRSAIVSLIRGHLAATCKRHGNRLLPLDPREDALSVWFSKEELDQLFRANGYAPGSGNRDDFGLRIYYGVHGAERGQYLAMPGRPDRYIGQHTAVLVVTRNGEDLLGPGDHVSIYQSEGALNGSFREEGGWEETALLKEL